MYLLFSFSFYLPTHSFYLYFFPSPSLLLSEQSHYITLTLVFRLQVFIGCSVFKQQEDWRVLIQHVGGPELILQATKQKAQKRQVLVWGPKPLGIMGT